MLTEINGIWRRGGETRCVVTWESFYRKPCGLQTLWIFFSSQIVMQVPRLWQIAHYACTCVFLCNSLTSFLSSAICSLSWVIYCLESEWFSWPWINPSSFCRQNIHTRTLNYTDIMVDRTFMNLVNRHGWYFSPVFLARLSFAGVQP